MIVVDFETQAIEDGTGKAPAPVGVAIWEESKEPRYLAWGHPTGNNSSFEEGKRALAAVWERPLLFHNAKFDCSVAEQHMGLPWPKQFDDTMYQIYLENPHAENVSLKPSSERYLGMAPEERDAIVDYVVAQGWTKSKAKAGAFIARCPAGLVAPYAIGDVKRTGLLHNYLYPILEKRQLLTPYQRELKLVPVLAEAERVGVRLDTGRLEADCQFYLGEFDKVAQRIFASLGREFDLDKPAELVRALIDSGAAESLPLTPTGRPSTAKQALDGSIKDPELKKLIRYRSALKTLLGTFMGPWLELSNHDRHLHPSWNSVRGDMYGTRTGRLSCSHPNLQNVPTEFDGLDIDGLALLPFMRRYILPDEGHILVAADYNGQEMRLLAHFAEGLAAEIYRNDPRADFHQIARDILHEVAGLDLKRKLVKIVGFSLIYGSGANALSELLGLPKNEAVEIRNHYLRSIPGLDKFLDDVSSRSGVKTWGGRWIPKEQSRYNTQTGRHMDFGYKLANHLIQGSAADQTKQSIIDFHNVKSGDSRFLMTVHDENVISVLAEPEAIKREVGKLKDSMEGLSGFDVPFIAEIETGHNWYDLTPYSLEL
jgi:DNA polymerase-1